MLLAETGKTLIQHTYEAASNSKIAEGVVVATDHPEIEAAVKNFGGRVMMTRADHASGTDRIAEVAGRFEELGFSDIEVVVNVQGDEPEIAGTAIDRLIQCLAENQDAAVSTLATPIRTKSLLLDMSCVKVVADDAGRAMYFSRSQIPAVRASDQIDSILQDVTPMFFQHIGVYAYRRQFLMQIPDLPRTFLEEMESLEQLRFLGSGWPVYVEVIEDSGKGIDTPDDYEMFVKRMAKR